MIAKRKRDKVALWLTTNDWMALLNPAETGASKYRRIMDDLEKQLDEAIDGISTAQEPR